MLLRATSSPLRACFVKEVPLIEVRLAFSLLPAYPSHACPALNYRLSSPEGRACDYITFSLSHLPPPRWLPQRRASIKDVELNRTPIICNPHNIYYVLHNVEQFLWEMAEVRKGHLKQHLDFSDPPPKPYRTAMYYLKLGTPEEFVALWKG